MRLFIAIDFKQAETTLRELQNQLDPTLARLKPAATFHLTLKFLGKTPEDMIESIKNKLNEIKFRPFSLTLDKIGVFPNENFIRAVWIGIKESREVAELQKKIESALEDFNFKKDFKFHPHMTLARVKFTLDRERFNKNLKELKPKPKTIEVKDFRLIKSNLTPTGPVYEDLGVFSSLS